MNEEKFTGKADFYDKFRPSYPTGFIDLLYDKTGAETVADIGAGTGIFTKCLAQKPWKITAVEPNADMLEKLRENCPDIEIINAPAENTGIASGSIGLVTAATAFHWFDKAKFREECRRILAPGGRLALIWNNHGVNDLVRERNRVFMKYCGICNSAAGTASEGDSFLRDGYFSEMEFFRFDNSVYMTEEEFVGYSLSHSYSLKKGEKNYDEFAQALYDIFREFGQGSRVLMPFDTDCYLGRV